MKELTLTASILLCYLFLGPAFSRSESEPGTSRNFPRLGDPNSVHEELAEDRVDSLRGGMERWNAWKDGLYERTGLKFAIEYNSLGRALSSSATSDDFLVGGNARLFGSWTLVGKDTDNHGSVIFRVDNRSRYTGFDPQNGRIAAGSGLPTGSLFPGREWGLVNLQWTQAIPDGKGDGIFGMSPADDYFHSYGLANPLTAFSNLAFSIGGEVAIPDTGLALAAGTMLGDNRYWEGGVHDANGSSSDPDFDFIGDWELYKNFEIGRTTAQDKLYRKHCHLSARHVDERTEAGVPEGWGVVGNAGWYFEESKLLPFLRGGWSDGGAALLDGQVSAEICRQFRDRDLGGVGVSWGSPSGTGLHDQWPGELFYRNQMGDLAITPSTLFVANPALDPSEDLMIIGGLRARVVFWEAKHVQA